MYDAFISYSHKDSDFVRSLHDRLNQEKFQIWVDWEDIPDASQWRDEISQGIDQADTFIFILSSHSVVSVECRKEVEYAVNNHKKLVPFVYRRDFEREKAHPALNQHQWIVANSDQDLEGQIQKLVKALRTDLAHVKSHTKLLNDAKHWVAKQRNPSLLLHGQALRDINQWQLQAGDKQPLLTPLQQDYINVSRQREAKSQTFRIWGAFSIAAVTGLLAVVAVWQMNQARAAQERAVQQSIASLANASKAAFFSDQQLKSLVDAVQAGRRVQSEGLESTSIADQAVIALQRPVQGFREYNRLTGHQDQVVGISFSADGDLLVSISRDGEVKLWQPNGKLVRTLENNGYWFTDVAVSPDHQLIATADGNGQITLWNQEGEHLQTLSDWYGDVIRSLTFSPDGTYLVSAHNNGTIGFWTLDAMQLKETADFLQAHEGPVSQVSFNADGTWFASSGFDGIVKLWRQDGSLAYTLPSHDSPVNHVSFSPDGKTIATASDDGTLKLWSLDGTLQETLIAHDSWVLDVRFGPDGQTLASASLDGKITLWDLQTQQPLHKFNAHQGEVNALTFSPDSKTLVSAGQDGTIKLWRSEVNLVQPLQGHQGSITTLDYSADGKTLISAGFDHTIQLWPQGDSTSISLRHHTDVVLDVRAHPQTDLLVSSSFDGTVKLWRQDGTFLGDLIDLSQEMSFVSRIAVSPDGKRLALLKGYLGHGSVNADAVNAEAVLLFEWESTDWTLTPTERNPIPIAAGDNIFDIEFSSVDGSILALAGSRKRTPDSSTNTGRPEGLVNLMQLDENLSEGVQSTELFYARPILDISFSPDGHFIATASLDGTGAVRRTGDGQSVSLLTGHTGSMNRVHFSHDGQMIVTAGNDGSIKLWQTADGNPLATLTAHEGAVLDIQFSPDDNTLVSAGRDTTIQQWNFKLDDLMENRCLWLRDYLTTNPAVMDPSICADYFPQEAPQ